MYLKALMFWLAMLVVAVAFGALRELAVTPVLGDMAARALCSVLLSAALFGLVLLFVRLARPSGHGALLSLGVFWAGLTLAFEFGMGWSRGLALEAMLADYDLLKGRLWTLVPLTLLFGPMAAASITRP
ncbi:MAG: hypothetical protein ACOZEN_07840 [Thermodesulfobacteriota bacterium]